MRNVELTWVESMVRMYVERPYRKELSLGSIVSSKFPQVLLRPLGNKWACLFWFLYLQWIPYLKRHIIWSYTTRKTLHLIKRSTRSPNIGFDSPFQKNGERGAEGKGESLPRVQTLGEPVSRYGGIGHQTCVYMEKTKPIKTKALTVGKKKREQIESGG